MSPRMTPRITHWMHPLAPVCLPPRNKGPPKGPHRMRRCTGFRPSLTSGSARPTMTLIAYCEGEGQVSSTGALLCKCV